jgi:hypothetical protein
MIVIGIILFFSIYGYLYVFSTPSILERFESTGISNIQEEKNGLPLFEYCIKSSYNTAMDGNNTMSVDTIKKILMNGCRLLDFELFYVDNVVEVAVSADKHNDTTITSKNSITLNDVFKCIITNAFSAPSPNPSDPLFIQLRIQAKDSVIYNEIGKIVDKYLKGLLFVGKVDGHTILSTLSNKIVLIIDITLSPSYAKLSYYPGCVRNESGAMVHSPTCFHLSNYVNIESGSHRLSMFSYSNMQRQSTTPLVVLNSKSPITKTMTLRLIVPDDNGEYKNPNSMKYVIDYGVQFVLNRFYINDSALKEYEEMFMKKKSAFVPFVDCIYSVEK